MVDQSWRVRRRELRFPSRVRTAPCSSSMWWARRG